MSQPYEKDVKSVVVVSESDGNGPGSKTRPLDAEDSGYVESKRSWRSYLWSCKLYDAWY